MQLAVYHKTNIRWSTSGHKVNFCLRSSFSTSRPRDFAQYSVCYNVRCKLVNVCWSCLLVFYGSCMSHVNTSAVITEPCIIHTLNNSTFFFFFNKTKESEKEIKMTGVMEMVPKWNVYVLDKCMSSVSFCLCYFCVMWPIYSEHTVTLCCLKEASFAGWQVLVLIYLTDVYP